MKITDKNMAQNQAYTARGVVAKYSPMGHYQDIAAPGRGIKVPIFRFMTLYQGQDREAIPVEYKRPAPVLPSADGGTELNIEALEEGDFVVSPGLVYRRCLWFDNLMAAHMKALRNFKPKTIIESHKAEEPAIDLGVFDHTSDQVTKQ